MKTLKTVLTVLFTLSIISMIFSYLKGDVSGVLCFGLLAGIINQSVK